MKNFNDNINVSFFVAGVIAIILYQVWPSLDAPWEFKMFAWIGVLICCTNILAGIRGLFGYWRQLKHVREAYKPSKLHGQAKPSSFDDLDDF